MDDVEARILEHAIELHDEVVEPEPRLEGLSARGVSGQREGEHAEVLRQRLHRRTHPLPPRLDARHEHERWPVAHVDHRCLFSPQPSGPSPQPWPSVARPCDAGLKPCPTGEGPSGPPQFLSGLPVLSVCWIRSSVLRSPHSARNASRSRSSSCASVTVVSCGDEPPARIHASFRPMSASWSLMRPARQREVDAERQRRAHALTAHPDGGSRRDGPIALLRERAGPAPSRRRSAARGSS